ncbi:MAG TPA: hypothetical protein VMU10_04795 [Desulfomonilia bacterium]|nr:hypothetical protein [Desulfomonilia bacterium]
MDATGIRHQQSGHLMFLEVLLLLLGLLSGLPIPFFANPRMGLSGHVEGVMSGMLLIIIGKEEQ